MKISKVNPGKLDDSFSPRDGPVVIQTSPGGWRAMPGGSKVAAGPGQGLGGRGAMPGAESGGSATDSFSWALFDYCFCYPFWVSSRVCRLLLFIVFVLFLVNAHSRTWIVFVFVLFLPGVVVSAFLSDSDESSDYCFFIVSGIVFLLFPPRTSRKGGQFWAP